MHPLAHPLRVLVAVCVVPTVLTLTALTPAAAAPTPKCHGLKATIVGTAQADRITGTDGDDVILALGGNDVVDGGGGLDVVCGDGGKDSIYSGPGELGLLYGGAGNDRLVAEDAGIGLIGEAGDDTLVTTHEGTLLDGGSGKDTIDGSDFPDVIDGGSGNDAIQANGGEDEDVHGGPGNDRVDGGDGLDVLHGDSGNDRISSGPGQLGLLHGGTGNDTLVAQDAGIGLLGEDGDDTLTTTHDATLLDGSSGNDTITGGGFADVVDGGSGNDTIATGGGDDVDVHGGAGHDQLDGGSGNDVLDAGAGVDSCTGGAGADQCHGGAPGSAANSPEDDDLCQAETMTSCRGGAFPDRWTIHVEGSWSSSDDEMTESATWTMDFVVRRGGRPTETWYVLESAAGGWSGEGTSSDGFTTCTWGGGGGFDEPDWSADLQLFPDSKEYFLDFVGDAVGEMPGVCRNKDYTSEISRMQFLPTHEDSGEADTLPFDPTNLEIRGSESHTRGNEQWTQSWTILPAG